ncbi:MAG TPA: hypothetical protein VM890_16230 [Longimicrobium sp.]|nr:hypothetical protein [Longimicrobium sp.]
MQVIDSEPAAWFLFEDGADLFLDVNCNHSAAGYSVLIKLLPEEVADYWTAGRSSISRLADRVQDSGPHGGYQKRDVSSTYGDASMEAVRAWRASTQ